MWELIRENRRKTYLLIGLMGLLMLGLGYLLGELFIAHGGLVGMGVAFIFWLFTASISYFQGDKIFLSISRARKIQPEDHPVLFNVVEEMKLASGLSRIPDVYIIDNPAPNAFATGRNPDRASVAVTSGLLEILDRDELQGVIAHELAHIKNHDVLYMLIAGAMMGAIFMLSEMGFRGMLYGGGRGRHSSNKGGGQALFMLVGVILMILAPLLAQLLYFSISRRREYLADACSAQYTRYPEGLARALEKLNESPHVLPNPNKALVPMYIVNPLKKSKQGLFASFSGMKRTHPPTPERISILRNMAGGAGFREYEKAFTRVSGRPVGVMPASLLASAESVPLREACPESTNVLERHQQVNNMFWKMNAYIAIACACGTNLKFPPSFTGRNVNCPHCQTPHTVQKAA